MHRGARALLFVAVIAVLIGFARTVDWAESWRSIRSTTPELLALAALAHVTSLVLKGTRWWVFLRPIGVRPLALALRVTFMGAALNNVLIANSGEAARVLWIARSERVSKGRVLATLLLERFFESFGYVVLLALSVSLFALPPALERLRAVAFVALAVMAGLLAYLARARRRSTRFLDTLTTISSGPRFGAAALLTAGVWSLQVASYHLTATAAGFPISLVGSIAALLACNASFALRATPGNVGVFQAVYAMIAVAFGMDRDAAIGVALLIQTQQVLSTTLLGLSAAATGTLPRAAPSPSPAS